MTDIFETKTCRIEFKSRHPYAIPFRLIHLLYKLSFLYAFPFQYTGNKNSIEDWILRLRNLYYEEEKVIEEIIEWENFIDYPLHIKNIEKASFDKYEQEFLQNLQNDLHMIPYHHEPFEKMDVEEFFNRYTEPDYDIY